MDFYSLEISSIETLTREAKKITFTVPTELRNVFQFKAGQYVIIRINGERREYSLCSSPLDNQWSIGVKSITNGEVSGYLVNKLKIGDKIEISKPYGLFGIPSKVNTERSILSFAAGSGITPVLSITRFILQTEPLTDLYLFYSNKAPDSVMFYEELKSLQNQYNRFHLYFNYTQAQSEESLFTGRLKGENIRMIIKRLLDSGNLEKIISCGPKSMITKILNEAKRSGIPEENVHHELFYVNQNPMEVPLIQGDPAESVEVMLTLEGVTRQIFWNKEIPLLHALHNAGIDAPYSCSRGQCGTCVCKLEEGEVHLKRNFVLSESHIKSGLILPCVSTPISTSIRINYDSL